MKNKILLPRNMALLNMILGLFVYIFFSQGSVNEKRLCVILIFILIAVNAYAYFKTKNKGVLKNVYLIAALNSVVVLFANVLNYGSFLFVFFIIYMLCALFILKSIKLENH